MWSGQRVSMNGQVGTIVSGPYERHPYTAVVLFDDGYKIVRLIELELVS